MKNELIEPIRSKGYGVSMATFFIVANMAGAGFLSLPRAMADSGWLGLVMILLFCGSVGFAATRLGTCWVMLEERWPEDYLKPARQPYMDIAEKSLGKRGRKLSLFCILTTLIGSTIVFIILIAEMLNDIAPVLSQCQWVIVVAILVTPLSWLGSPKDFWQTSVFAVIATLVAILVIVVEIILTYGTRQNYPPPSHPYPNVKTFAFGFGAILFSFGGCSVFPTLQNDMHNRSQFWKAIVIGFAIILALYLPVAILGYVFIGFDVESNILLSLDSNPVVTAAIALEICNLLGTFIIALSPVVQSLEDLMNIPPNFGVKRITLRTTLIAFEVLVALAIPDFGLILNLIGGSTITCLSFLFPPLMYMKLVDDKSNPKWRQRSIPLWERIYLWEIFIVGVVGGLISTVSALYAILDPESFGKSCFVTFNGES